MALTGCIMVYFPTTHGRTLEDIRLTLPYDLDGRIHRVDVGFQPHPANRNAHMVAHLA
jgi:hypothetical protein